MLALHMFCVLSYLLFIHLFRCQSFLIPSRVFFKYWNIKKPIQSSNLKEPSIEDMKQVAIILANITEYLYDKPGTAMNIVTENIGFLYSRNIPVYVIKIT